MIRTTMYGAILAAVVLTGCASPMEQADDLIATMAANGKVAIERSTAQLEAFQAIRDGIDGDCGDNRSRFIPFPLRNANQLTPRMSDELANPINDARKSCRSAQTAVAMLLRGAERRAEVTPQQIDTLVTGLKMLTSEMNEEALSMLLDTGESDEEAWTALVTAMGHENLASGLTEAQHDAERAEHQASFEEAVSELETRLELLAAAYVAWEELLAELGSGSWSPPEDGA